MTRVICGKETRDESARLYARIESDTDQRAGSLRRVTFGTLPEAHLDRDVVSTATDADGIVILNQIDGHFETEIREDFEERSLEDFVSEFTERTPYPVAEAEVIVTHGWFDLDVEETVQVISQFLRDPYDDVSEEWVQKRLADARATRDLIENAAEYPFGV